MERPSEMAAMAAQERWDAIAKPLGSLGSLEAAIIKIAELTGNADVSLDKRAMAVFCADNGVLAQGVSQSGAEVTRLVARNVARGLSSVNRMCAAVRIDCIAVDLGMREPLDEPNMLSRRVAAGTGDISLGPAMTRAQAVEGIRVGVELVEDLVGQGYRIIGTGEVGIGNTTTATAMTCAFTDADPSEYTGRGAGLTDEGLLRKAEIIRRALGVNQPDPSDPLGVLAKVGGFDIAAMCGVFLGGAVYRVPIIIDGVISTAAAYCAAQLRPECTVAMLASHLSTEPSESPLMARLGLEPVIHAHMRLGEGTGAACLVPLLDMALSVYDTAATLAGSDITSYDSSGLR